MGRTLTRSHLTLLLLPERTASALVAGPSPCLASSSSLAADDDDVCFTLAELAAAEQLVQLSESSADSPSPSAADAGAASSSSSCSPRSVNTRPPASAVLMEAEEEEEETGLRRRTKRYRPIADLYAATRPVKGRPVSRTSRACGGRLRF